VFQEAGVFVRGDGDDQVLGQSVRLKDGDATREAKGPQVGLQRGVWRERWVHGRDNRGRGLGPPGEEVEHKDDERAGEEEPSADSDGRHGWCCRALDRKSVDIAIKLITSRLVCLRTTEVCRMLRLVS